MSRRGFQPSAQGSNQENWRQGQGNQGRNYGNYNREVIMFEMRITTATTTSIGVTMVTEMIGVDTMIHLKIVKFLLGMVDVVWHELRIYCRK